MADNPEYRRDIFTWLESIIKCELLDTADIIQETEGKPLPKPKRAPGVTNPRLQDLPLLTTPSVTDVILRNCFLSIDRFFCKFICKFAGSRNYLGIKEIRTKVRVTRVRRYLVCMERSERT